MYLFGAGPAGTISFVIAGIKRDLVAYSLTMGQTCTFGHSGPNLVVSPTVVVVCHTSQHAIADAFMQRARDIPTGVTCSPWAAVVS